MRLRLSVAVAALAIMGACATRKAGEPLQPGFNLFSRQQDVELGREAAAQVRKQYQVAQSPALQAYLRRIGERLARTPAAGDFPYRFTVLNNPDVNAFALPGGPVFIDTGLIQAVDTEAELAGVIAHEMAHVELRHGTSQVSKAELLQIPVALAGATLGQGAAAQIIQLGLGAGLNGVFLSYSREAESEADALGARIMQQAGYNPLAMAQFFERLETTGGPRGPQFLSSHPNPGNRVRAVEAEIRTLPRRQYRTGSPAALAAAKRDIAKLPPPPRSPRAHAAAPSSELPERVHRGGAEIAEAAQR